MIAYIYIIALVSIIGLTMVFGNVWKGICYTVWAFAALAFWWALAITIGLLPWPL